VNKLPHLHLLPHLHRHLHPQHHLHPHLQLDSQALESHSQGPVIIYVVDVPYVLEDPQYVILI
jgi:hypothetical protein